MSTKLIKYFWRVFEYTGFGFLIYKALGHGHLYIDRFLSMYEMFLVAGIFCTIITFFYLSRLRESADMEVIRRLVEKQTILRYLDPSITFVMGVLVWVFLGNKSLSILLLINPLFSSQLRHSCKNILEKHDESDSQKKDD